SRLEDDVTVWVIPDHPGRAIVCTSRIMRRALAAGRRSRPAIREPLPIVPAGWARDLGAAPCPGHGCGEPGRSCWPLAFFEVKRARSPGLLFFGMPRAGIRGEIDRPCPARLTQRTRR